MKRLKTWVNRMSIKKKLIFYSYLIITPILLVISTALFINNYKESLDKVNAAHIQNVDGISESLAVLQNDMTDFCTYICINNDILQILKSDAPYELNKDAQLWKHLAPMEMLEDMVALKGYIKTVAIYPENGVNPYLRCIDATAYLGTMEDVGKTSIYKYVKDQKGRIIWKRTARNSGDTYRANRADKIVLYREIYDLSKKNALGYLVIGASADTFGDLCSTKGGENGNILVLSAEGNVLIRNSNIETKILRYLKRLRDTTEIYKKENVQFSYGDYEIFASQKNKNGFIVYKIVHKVGIGSGLYSIAYAPMVLLLGFLAGLFPILIFVSNIISKPLKKLCIAMSQFKQGDFSQQVEVITQDEVGEVTEGFNEMVVSIKVLIDNNYVMELKEKQSELKALQAQINPHFLYNTLDSLYWRAQDAEDEELAEDILALSQLFRLVLGQGKGIITVREEQKLIATYLHIQKMRFTKRMDYTIEIEDEIQDYDIPKLILQPFVENAIVHGFERAGTLCSLFITGIRKEDKMVFQIKDTGIGMTKEQMDAIWNVEDSKRYSGQRVVSYAIKNVKERLELRYQKNFNLDIESQIGSGTTITIEIPLGNKEG